MEYVALAITVLLFLAGVPAVVLYLKGSTAKAREDVREAAKKAATDTSAILREEIEALEIKNNRLEENFIECEKGRAVAQAEIRTLERRLTEVEKHVMSPEALKAAMSIHTEALVAGLKAMRTDLAEIVSEGGEK